MDFDVNNVQHNFAERMKELRTLAGLSQGTLAEKLGVSRGSISFYENCDRVPDIAFLMSASAFFGVSPDYLLGFSSAPTADIKEAAACEVTGLPYEAIQKLQKLSHAEKKLITDLLSSGDDLNALALAYAKLKEIKSLRASMDDLLIPKEWKSDLDYIRYTLANRFSMFAEQGEA